MCIARSDWRRPIALIALVVSAFALTSASAQDAGSTDLRTLRARAVRDAVARTAPSVVRVELVGVREVEGEVAGDAPTVAVAVDDEGHFLASSLVLRGDPTSILLVAPDGRRTVAEKVARDHSRRLILLRASEDIGIPPITLEPTEVRVGQTVIAVGRQSGGESPAVSTGILSATERNWGLALQTDARVSSTFYGGPLIDLYGRVLGILVPMVPDGGAPEETGWYDAGVAFAIPTADILERLPKWRDGTDTHPGLVGIVAAEKDPYVETSEIAAVRPRSPAARADLRSGDSLTAIDGVPIRSHREIKQLLGPRDAGTAVRLSIDRDGETLEKEVTLAESIPPLVPQHLGIAVDASLRVTGIVADSPVEETLRVGDRIVSVDGSEFDEVTSLRSRVLAADPDEPLKIGLIRDEEETEVSVTTVPWAAVTWDQLPESLRYRPAADETWNVDDFDLPDIPNSAVIHAPQRADEGNGGGQADDEAEDDDAAAVGRRLGLILLLADPGEADLKKLLADWTEASKSRGVVVCAVAPAKEDRWTPDELDIPERVAAAVRRNYDIDPSMQLVMGSGKGPGGSMALAAAIGKPGTFSGLAAVADVRPPAIRLRENDPESPVHVLITGSEEQADLPGWASSLRRAGFTVIAGEGGPQAVMTWVRSLGRI